MSEKINQNGDSQEPEESPKQPKDLSQLLGNRPQDLSQLLGNQNLNDLLSEQNLQAMNIKPADLNAMIQSMMGSFPATAQAYPGDDEDYDDDEDEESDEDYDDDEDDDEDYDDDEDEEATSQQSAYQMAQSLMSSPLFSQVSALMGGPKLTEIERLYNQGKTYQANGMLDEAADTFLDVIDANPEHFGAYIGMGQVLLTLDRPEDAISFLAKAIELQPQDPSGYLYLGYAHYALREYEACVADFGRAAALEPQNNLSANNYGFAQFLTKRLDEAAQTFVRAGDAGSERAYYNLGMIYLLKDQEKKAWDAYQEGFDLDPYGSQIEDHLRDLSHAYELYPEKSALLDQAVEKLQLRLAELQGDYDEDEADPDYDDEADDGED